MISIGHRTGLFDRMAAMPPSTLEQIAAQTGLEHRYVKEWSSAMVACGVSQYSVDEERYQLPQSHALLLTRAASSDNIAVFAQYISMLGQVEDRIVDCFRVGGGVGYEYYPRFHKVMAKDSAQTVLAGLESHIIPLLKDMVPRLEQGLRVLDIGCGKGRVLMHMASRYPKSLCIGYDLSVEALQEARDEAAGRNLENVRFIQLDLTRFDQQGEADVYDFVTAFDAIHDQAAPQKVLNGIYKTLKPGGTFLMQDIRASSRLEGNLEHPIAPFLYTISTMHCMTVSLAQGGARLVTMWGEELAIEMLGGAGFDEIIVKQLEHDFQNNFYIMRK